MILPESVKDKSLFLTQLIGFSVVENHNGECTIYLNNEFVGCFNKPGWNCTSPIVNFYAPENMRLAWHAAAYGFLHFPEYKKWWESNVTETAVTSFENQAQWLDKLLYTAIDQISFFMPGSSFSHC